jgi:integrase
MQYLDRSEIRRFFTVAYEKGTRRHHLALLMGFWHGLRCSEVINILGSDIQDGQLSVQRLKGSNATLQPIHRDANPAFDCSPLLAIAAATPNARLFPFCRQRIDQIVKRYGAMAGLHSDKCHAHAAGKHAIAMVVWEETHSLGQIQSYLGHKSSSSSLQYLREVDHTKAQDAVAGIQL